MFLFLVFTALAIVLWYWYRKRNPNYIKETIDFFSTQETPWLSSDQLKQFKYCSQYNCYAFILSQLNVPSLIISMLIGQPLRYIWRDRNTRHLILYLNSLKQYRLNFSESITGHSSLYIEEYGEWPQGTNIIRHFTQIKK